MALGWTDLCYDTHLEASVSMISSKESMSKPISSFSLLRSSIVHCVKRSVPSRIREEPFANGSNGFNE